MVASFIQALLPSNTPRWNSGRPLGSATTVTYSFLNDVPSYYGNGGERNGFAALNASQQVGFRNAMSRWSNVSNLSFREVTSGNGQINVGTTRAPGSAGYAFYPGTAAGGDVWLSNSDRNTFDIRPGTDGFHTALHELGHALGLEHSHSGTELDESHDSYQYTVMSYRDHPDMPGVEPSTPMLYDIAAIQYLYGANTNHNSGNNTYSWGQNATFLETIWDGGGNDTIDASNQTRASQIDLRAGQFSSIGSYRNQRDAKNNLAIAFNVTIENANGGSANDIIYGNSAANLIRGNDGNDRLYGYGGNDRIFGGNGNDHIDSGSPGEYFSGNAYLSGDAGNDTLIGGHGRDTLAGGTGNDVLKGYNGNDELWGQQGDDQLYGQDGNDNLIGHAGNDVLYGGDGRDRLDGYSTSGEEYDTLYGGAGGDTFILGGMWGVSYQGPGFATIADWEWERDFIEVRGSSGQYSLIQGNWTGSGALDTGIVRSDNRGDLIGVVADSTNVSINRDFSFV